MNAVGSGQRLHLSYSSQPTLDEDKLVAEILDPESIAAWEKAFAALEKYAQHLMTLTSGNLTEDFRNQAVTLAEQIKTTGESLNQAGLVAGIPSVPTPVATGFVKLGDVLIRAGAQSRAKTILRETDPEIQVLLNNMADTIGATRDEGLRGTALAHWNQANTTNVSAFLTAPDMEAKRRVVIQYLEVRQLRETNDALLASLERSLRSLASAHRALAVGNRPQVGAAVAFINEEVQDTKRLYEKLAEALGETEN